MNEPTLRSRRTSTLLLVSLSLYVTGCSSMHAHSALPGVKQPQSESLTASSIKALEDQLPSITDADLDANIESSLPGEERAVMHKIMAGLPVKARKNVVYVDGNGRIYANRAFLKAGTHLRPIRGNKITDEDGHVYAAPPRTPRPKRSRIGTNSGQRRTREVNPPQTSDSGPWLRFLPSYTGYTKATFGFIVPRRATPVTSVGEHQDTGYIYSGGWNEDGSDSVDAGFDYSAYRDVLNIFMSSYASRRGQIFNNSFDFAPGRPTAVQFLFDGTNLVVCGDGYDTLGRINSLSVVEQAVDPRSWASGQDVLKYMVTIAQGPTPISYPGYYLDGYWFGASGTSPLIELRGFEAVTYGTERGCVFGTNECPTGDELGYELVPDDPSHILISQPFFTTEIDGPPGQFAYRVGIQLDDPAGIPCTLDPLGYCSTSNTNYSSGWCNDEFMSYTYTQVYTTYTVFSGTGMAPIGYPYITTDPVVPCYGPGWVNGEPSIVYSDPYLP